MIERVASFVREHGLLDPNAGPGESPFDHQVYCSGCGFRRSGRHVFGRGRDRSHDGLRRTGRRGGLLTACEAAVDGAQLLGGAFAQFEMRIVVATILRRGLVWAAVLVLVDVSGRRVLEVGGEGRPGWDVRYVDEASSQGSGDPVEVAGGAVLQLTMTGAGYPYETGIEEGSEPRGGNLALYDPRLPASRMLPFDLRALRLLARLPCG